MVLPLYLAMTAAEIRGSQDFPPNLGYMACHFSPYGTGLSNCPAQLPENAILILNDRTPIHGHDHEVIAGQLAQLVERLKCDSVLLDFQRPEVESLYFLAEKLTVSLPCPVGVSDLYAKDLDCAVFLPPVMPDMLLGEYFAPWKGRDIWLDISTEGQEITLTEKGAEVTIIPQYACPENSHGDTALHCHYRIELAETARFTLFRTEQDLTDLLTEASQLGVSRAVGLYQELHSLTHNHNHRPCRWYALAPLGHALG